MSILDIASLVVAVVVVALNCAGVLGDKALAAMVIIYTAVLIVACVCYGIGYYRVVTSAPLAIYIIVNVAWEAISLALLVITWVVRVACRRK